MSDFTPEPDQRFRSPLGLPPGSPGPMGLAAPEPPPGLDITPPGALPPLPPPGGDSEVDLLKSMLVLARDYTDLPTVEEDERLKMERITTSLQGLLAANQKKIPALAGDSGS